jgi:hypothetical protein
MATQTTRNADRYLYRAHVHVTVDPVVNESQALITLDTPLNLQAAEAVITAALAEIRAMGEVDPAMLVAGRALLASLPVVLDRVVKNWSLMPVEIVNTREHGAAGAQRRRTGRQPYGF